MKRNAIVIISCLLCSCGIFTFSGSTLPKHLKTVNIPIFSNTSLQSGIAEEMTNTLSKKVLSENLLRVVNTEGDATISGTVTYYNNSPRTYESNGARSVTISEYIVKISVDVDFIDNKNNTHLFKGIVSGQGIYDFQKETEQTGRLRAEDDIVEQILQNSLQSW
jgi:hypothetical protein